MNEESPRNSSLWRFCGIASLLLAIVLIWDRGRLFQSQLKAVRYLIDEFEAVGHPLTEYFLSLPKWAFIAFGLVISIILIAKEFVLNHRPVSTVVNLFALVAVLLGINFVTSAIIYDQFAIATGLEALIDAQEIVINRLERGG